MPRYPRPSATTEGLSARVYSALKEQMDAHEGPLHPLHVGDTWMEPPPQARVEQLLTSEHPGLHKYAPPHGLPELIEAVSDRILETSGVRRAPDQIQIAAGASSGLSVVAQTILDPGDEVIIPSPFWPLIRGIVQAAGGVPVQVPLYTRLADPEFDAAAAASAIEAVITDRTVAVYLNSPNNPTGAVLDGATVDAIGAVAVRHDLWMIFDEAYEDIWLDGDRPSACWARPSVLDRAIVTHTMSKSFGMAGARVGWTHGPAEAIDTIRGMHTYQVYCAPRPTQLAAVRALRTGAAWQEEMRANHLRAAQIATGALDLPMPPGGTFLFFPLDGRMREGEEVLGFLRRCVDADIIIVPGGACGVGYERWARLCFTSVGHAELQRAVIKLRRVIDDR